jgi:hypothetical protein
MTVTASGTTITTSTAITPADFCQRTTCATRDRWNLAAMQILIEQLGGVPVAIVTDARTGFTLVGARLVSAYRGGWGPRVRVATTHTPTDGQPLEQQTDYRLEAVGMVLPLGGEVATGNAKWNSLRRYREIKSAAITKARAEHGGPEGRAWGEWSATLLSVREASVTYTPLTGNPAKADQWGTRGHWTVTL